MAVAKRRIRSTKKESLDGSTSSVGSDNSLGVSTDGITLEWNGSAPWLSDLDYHLLSEGNHYRSFEKFGAHRVLKDGVPGVHFLVWAPNAEFVSVIGNFNNWDSQANPMSNHPQIGCWSTFVPEVKSGETYKFFIRSRVSGASFEKIDPYAFYAEKPPLSASVVFELGGYSWNDQEWMMRRRERHTLHSPMSIYEVHLGSWARNPEEGNRTLTYRELAHKLAEYVRRLGFTHIELLPISEHPFDGSWGYQTLGYFGATSRFGTPHDFMYFVDVMHQHDIGVIVDWVPAHFPCDGHGLAVFDGTHLYEHSDPREGYHPDWKSAIFNYGRHEVRNFLISSALFWLEKYHIDGLRVDAVASMLYRDYSREQGEWIPNVYGGRENLEAIEFLKRLNAVVYEQHPDVLTIAEESTAWPMVSRPTYVGGLGFAYKWNMGWMNDTLRYMSKECVHRSYHQNDLTFGLLYAFQENFLLPLSHDEVVHGKGSLIGKMPGDDWQQFANLRLLYSYMWGYPGKKLLFMGCEFAQWSEWVSSQSLDWHLLEYDRHEGIRQLIQDLNMHLRHEPSLHKHDCSWEGFRWVDCHDSQNSVLSFVRSGDPQDPPVLVVCNFTPVPRYGYRIGVPWKGHWREILNSDAGVYGGGNIGNGGGVHASDEGAHGFPHSLQLTLPPLGAVYLTPES